MNERPAPVTSNAGSTRREAADCTSRLCVVLEAARSGSCTHRMTHVTAEDKKSEQLSAEFHIILN